MRPGSGTRGGAGGAEPVTVEMMVSLCADDQWTSAPLVAGLGGGELRPGGVGQCTSPMGAGRCCGGISVRQDMESLSGNGASGGGGSGR
jgi:hypothetical protein